MGRLFYEKEAHDVHRAGTRSGTGSPNIYLEKVSKLIPAEIIAAYIAIIGLIEKVPINIQDFTKWIVFFFCLVLTPLYLWKLSEKDKPMMNHLFLSTLAYIIWSYAISGRLLVGDLYDSAVSSICLILFTLISGAVPLTKSK